MTLLNKHTFGKKKASGGGDFTESWANSSVFVSVNGLQLTHNQGLQNWRDAISTNSRKVSDGGKWYAECYVTSAARTQRDNVQMGMCIASSDLDSNDVFGNTSRLTIGQTNGSARAIGCGASVTGASFGLPSVPFYLGLMVDFDADLFGVSVDGVEDLSGFGAQTPSRLITLNPTEDSLYMCAPILGNAVNPVGLWNFGATPFNSLPANYTAWNG
jgi:hypothetical protein